MIALTDITASSPDPRRVVLTWAFVDTEEALESYTIQVFRSESSAGPFVEVGPSFPADTRDFWVDETVQRGVLRREHLYRLKVVGDDATMWYGSTPYERVWAGESPGAVALEAPAGVIAQEVMRRFELDARASGGEMLLHLRARSTGQYCPSCYDVKRRRSINDRCRVCWGTQRTGGYYSPAEVWGKRVDVESDRAHLLRFSEMERRGKVYQFSALNRMGIRDLLVRPNGNRYRIEALPQQHRQGGALTHVVAQLTEIETTDIEHEIPVVWSQTSRSALDPRRYSVHTDIDDADGLPPFDPNPFGIRTDL